VDVRGLEPLTPCLQSRADKTLNALPGVAYTETDKIFALSKVPKLYRISASLLSAFHGVATACQIQLLILLIKSCPDRSGLKSIAWWDCRTRVPALSCRPCRNDKIKRQSRYAKTVRAGITGIYCYISSNDARARWNIDR
jgi:hypothetical protein